MALPQLRRPSPPIWHNPSLQFDTIFADQNILTLELQTWGWTVKDYLDNAKEIIKPDGGPPRWFCPVECGCPLKDLPILLFLPGNHCLSTGFEDFGSQFIMTYVNV
ncbi:Acyltransferase-like protein [Camellia lanceoleosa]|uniref:Acyltransferase-like protein n=1 Tax=Camellia lanceoleosa TaxID=1840588 RepID=A0ACC0J3T9_9ERIC|nr:Acyltransferase-like protein [Camellia lanceoleosa]